MADIRNWDAYRAGRWDWTRLGYDRAFPGFIGIGDIDGHVEIGGNHLFIECKSNGTELPTGQRIALESLNKHGHTILILTGDAIENLPARLDLWLPDGQRKQLINHQMSVEQKRQTLMATFSSWARWAQRGKDQTA